MADRLQAGDLLARNSLQRNDELGFLSRTINRMADSLAAQLLVQGGMGQITETLVAAKSIEAFGKELLNILMELTNSVMASFYMRGEAKSSFALVQSIGAISQPSRDFDVEGLEGASISG